MQEFYIIFFLTIYYYIWLSVQIKLYQIPQIIEIWELFVDSIKNFNFILNSFLYFFIYFLPEGKSSSHRWRFSSTGTSSLLLLFFSCHYYYCHNYHSFVNVIIITISIAICNGWKSIRHQITISFS